MVCQRVAPAQRPLALGRRHGLADVVSDGGNVGHDHDGQDNAGGQQALAAAGRLGAPQPLEQLSERGGEKIHAPKAVDHAGDRRQQLDEERTDPFDGGRGDLRQIRRRADAQGDGEEHGESGRDDGAVDERGAAEGGRLRGRRRPRRSRDLRAAIGSGSHLGDVRTVPPTVRAAGSDPPTEDGDDQPEQARAGCRPPGSKRP